MSENKSNYLYTVQCVQGNVCRAVYVEQPVHACIGQRPKCSLHMHS